MPRHIATVAMSLWSAVLLGAGSAHTRPALDVGRDPGAWGVRSNPGQGTTAATAIVSSSHDIDIDVWSVFVATVAADDVVRMGEVYFPNAVLVGPRGTKPIKEALEGWGHDMVAAKAKGNRATVEFRFARRQDDATTAFEAGMFRVHRHREVRREQLEVLSVRAADGEDERQVACAHGTPVCGSDARCVGQAPQVKDPRNLWQKPKRDRLHRHLKNRSWESSTTIGRGVQWARRRDWSWPICWPTARCTSTSSPSAAKRMRRVFFGCSGRWRARGSSGRRRQGYSPIRRRATACAAGSGLAMGVDPHDSLFGRSVFDGWRGLMQALENGRPGFDQVFGQSAWSHLQANPQQGTIFNQAMRDLSAAMTPAVTASFDWSRFPVIADIGGGIGAQLLNILDAHPSCQGILFDQPQVVAEAPHHDRMERVVGDFFADIPVSADAYLLRWIIHDWADDEAIAILANVRKAAKPGARLVLVESVIPDTPAFDMGKWMDMNMLVMAGGCERTASEFRDLYRPRWFRTRANRPHAVAAEHRCRKAASLRKMHRVRP